MNNLRKIINDNNISVTQLHAKINERKSQDLSYQTVHSIVNNKTFGSRHSQSKIFLALQDLLSPIVIDRNDVFPEGSDDSNVKLNSVFNQFGVPKYTFVKTDEYKELRSVIDSGICVSIEGPSGIGKTSCVKKLLTDMDIFNRYAYYSARTQEDIDSIKKIAEGKLNSNCIIDDIHRLDEDLRKLITDQLKYQAEQESDKKQIIILGINKVERSLFALSPDLVGRLIMIKFKPVKKDKLLELIELGEQTLNIELKHKDEIAEAAQGSFQLLQILCHISCNEAGILSRQDEKVVVDVNIKLVKEKLFDQMASAFLDNTRRIATEDFKKNQSGRAPYLTLLYMLSKSESNSISLTDVRMVNQRLSSVLEGFITSGALEEHLNRNIFSDLIYFDKVSNTLFTEDPKFFYYLKNLDWEDFARKCGFDTTEFALKYDYALSFSHSEDNIAEAIAKKLNADTVPTFYYINEQSKMLGGDIGDYLKPVYASESDLIIPIISSNYARGFWTRFEADIIKERVAEKRVIPILVDGAYIGIFDEQKNITSIPFSTKERFDDQIDRIVEVLETTIVSRRRK